jgi:hypothetical protein
VSDCSTSTFCYFIMSIYHFTKRVMDIKVGDMFLTLHKKLEIPSNCKKCYMYIGSFSMKLLYTCIFKGSSPSKAPADGLVSIKR